MTEPPTTRSGLRRLLSIPSLIVGGAVAAVAAYFLDPDRGRSRRAQARDQLAGRLRHEARRGGRLARRATSLGAGKLEMMQHRVHARHEEPNDADLEAKVRTELFRDRSIPKGDIVINAEDGTIVLRGTVASGEQRDRIVARTLRINDVIDVRNLLRVPEEVPAAIQGEADTAGIDLRTSSFGPG